MAVHRFSVTAGPSGEEFAVTCEVFSRIEENGVAAIVWSGRATKANGATIALTRTHTNCSTDYLAMDEALAARLLATGSIEARLAA